MNKSEINKMTMQEKLQTMEILWDSILHEEQDVQIPEWHEDILKERKKKRENGEAQYISLSELRSKYNDQNQ